MKQDYSQYNRATGVFTSMIVSHHDGKPDEQDKSLAWWPDRVDHSAWRVQDGELVPYKPPAPSAAAFEADARATRAALLAASDWVVLRAMERGELVPKDWADYREALRNVTKQPGFSRAIDWPAPPG